MSRNTRLLRSRSFTPNSSKSLRRWQKNNWSKKWPERMKTTKRRFQRMKFIVSWRQGMDRTAILSRIKIRSCIQHCCRTIVMATWFWTLTMCGWQFFFISRIIQITMLRRWGICWWNTRVRWSWRSSKLLGPWKSPFSCKKTGTIFSKRSSKRSKRKPLKELLIV